MCGENRLERTIMNDRGDLAIFDRPEVLSIIFYPRKDLKRSILKPNWSDHSIHVDEGVDIECRLYVADKDSPNLLYFHGNGEIVSDHDDLAQVYNERGINLFVADYRGYGNSTGIPTVSSMLMDAHKIFHSFLKILEMKGLSGLPFLMGRSLGSASVIEIGYYYQKMIAGMIIESGFADPIGLLRRIGLSIDSLEMKAGRGFSNIDKITFIEIPTLIIHGEFDFIIPVEDGRMLYERSGAREKRLVIINGAGHNDLLLMGFEDYFRAIEEFLHTYNIDLYSRNSSKF
jgi:alpha-beta hydrolase superfamily lysophospholipase